METTKVLEQAYVDLKEAKDALAEAQERLRVAEEQNSKLTEEVNTKDQKIDKILSKAKSFEEKYEHLVAAMQLEKEQGKTLSKDVFEVTSRLDKMTSDLGSKAKKRNFDEEDTRAAVKWTLLSHDVLRRVVRSFSSFCFAAGAQCLTASLERDKCGHVQHLTKVPLLFLRRTFRSLLQWLIPWGSMCFPCVGRKAR